MKKSKGHKRYKNNVTEVGGRLIDENGPRKCTSCGGEFGWRQENDKVTHSCGAVQ